MSASLVGSEMCIRDSHPDRKATVSSRTRQPPPPDLDQLLADASQAAPLQPRLRKRPAAHQEKIVKKPAAAAADDHRAGHANDEDMDSAAASSIQKYHDIIALLPGWAKPPPTLGTKTNYTVAPPRHPEIKFQ
eukprot:10387225-Alexandrium_andersonii.AAC.1